MLSDDELLTAYHGDDQHGHIFMDGAHGAGLRRLEAVVRADLLPEGAKWFPIEGGFMWQGEVYYPADYVMTREDIAAQAAEVRADQIEKDAAIVESKPRDRDGWFSPIAVATAIRAQLQNGEK